MKKIASFLIIVLVGMSISLVSAEENMRICTMEYDPVCGINGVTYGNACAAGDIEIIHQGECKSYIDQNLYAKIEGNTRYVNKVERILSQVTVPRLDTAVVNIEQRIKMVKMSRIAESVQVERITKLTFLRDAIQIEMSMRDKK